MKFRVFFLLSAVSLFALSSCRDHLTGPNPATPVVNDTIAHWYLYGSLMDPWHHDGIGNGTIMYGTDRFGNSNHALILDGKTDVIVPNAPDLNFNGDSSYTISLWVKTSMPEAPFVSKGPADSSEPGYQLFLSQYGYPYAKITNTAGVFSQSEFSMPNVLDGQWHLVTLVVSAPESVNLYVDSCLAVTFHEPGMEPELNNSAPLFIGSSPTGSTKLTGSIDDVLILRGAIDPVEVAARFHEGGWYEHTDTTVITPPDTTKPGQWTPVNTGTNQSLVIGQFVYGGWGFVSGSNGVFLATNDSGNTWSTRGTVPTLYGGNTIYGLSFFGNQTGFAAGDQRVISKTTDGGYTWQTMNTANMPQTDLIRSLWFSTPQIGFAGTSDAYAGPSGSICQTTDGGQTWNPIFSTSGGIYNIAHNEFGGSSAVATGCYGVVYWTSDSGKTWHPGSSDEPNSVIYSTVFTSATNGFAVATAPLTGTPTTGYILSTSDGGHTWTTIKTVSNGLMRIASNFANGTITAVGSNGIIVESTDGGTTWSQSFVGSNQWNDIVYVSLHRALLFGANGAIDVRVK